MEAVNEKIYHELADILDIDSETLIDYLKENNLDPSEIKQELENSNFDKDMIAYLFNYDYSIYFNPFIFLLLEMKDEIKNMNYNVSYFDKYNLKNDIIRFYYGVANFFSYGPDFLKKIITPVLKKFDENLKICIEKSEKGQSEDINKFIKQLTNMLKFNNGDLSDESCLRKYVRNIVNIGYMQIFLRMANVDKETFEICRNFELQISADSSYGTVQPKIFSAIDLYDKIVFDRAIEMVINDFDSNANANDIYDLFEQFVDNAETAEELEKYLDKEENKTDVKTEIKEVVEEQNSEINLSLSYLNLEKILKEKIIGQDHVIDEVIARMKIAELGVSKEVGAKAVILLAGPTGVGKTEMVKLISKAISKNDSNDKNKSKDKTDLIRLDMSEYQEEHTVSKILGAPPGYVGFEEKEDNTVFDKVIKNPNAVILLDEIEKGHEKVLDVFIHIMDEGKATTNKQKIVDFRNNLIFMTTNIGSVEAKRNKMGFDSGENLNLEKTDVYKKALESQLRPEIINRMDEILVFKTLNKDDIIVIIENKLRDIEQKLMSKNNVDIKIDLSNSALEYIINEMKFEQYGAREVRRVIERNVVKEVCKLVLNGITSGTLHIDCIGNQLNYNFEQYKVLRKEM